MNNLPINFNGRSRHDTILDDFYLIGNFMNGHGDAQFYSFTLYSVNGRFTTRTPFTKNSNLHNYPPKIKLNKYPMPTKATKRNPTNNNNIWGLRTLRKIKSSGSEIATMLMIKARIVPTGTPLFIKTSATGIMPVAFE